MKGVFRLADEGCSITIVFHFNITTSNLQSTSADLKTIDNNNDF